MDDKVESFNKTIPILYTFFSSSVGWNFLGSNSFGVSDIIGTALVIILVKVWKSSESRKCCDARYSYPSHLIGIPLITID